MRTAIERTAMPEDAADIARGWVEALGRRDAEALTRLSHPRIRYTTSVLADKQTYVGHDGLRECVACVAARGWDEIGVIDDVRRYSDTAAAVSGDVLAGSERVNPFSIVLRLCDGLVISAAAYLSDRSLLDHVGHTPERAGSRAGR